MPAADMMSAQWRNGFAGMAWRMARDQERPRDRSRERPQDDDPSEPQPQPRAHPQHLETEGLRGLGAETLRGNPLATSHTSAEDNQFSEERFFHSQLPGSRHASRRLSRADWESEMRAQRAAQTFRNFWGVMMIGLLWMAMLHHTFRFATLTLLHTYSTYLPMEFRALDWAARGRINRDTDYLYGAGRPRMHSLDPLVRTDFHPIHSQDGRHVIGLMAVPVSQSWGSLRPSSDRDKENAASELGPEGLRKSERSFLVPLTFRFVKDKNGHPRPTLEHKMDDKELAESSRSASSEHASELTDFNPMRLQMKSRQLRNKMMGVEEANTAVEGDAADRSDALLKLHLSPSASPAQNNSPSQRLFWDDSYSRESRIRDGQQRLKQQFDTMIHRSDDSQ